MDLKIYEEIYERLKKASSYFENSFENDIPEAKKWAEQEFNKLVKNFINLWVNECPGDRIKNLSIFEKVLSEVIKIRKMLELDFFNPDRAFKKLLAANRWLSLNFTWDNWGKGIDNYLKNNKPLNDILLEADEMIEIAFDKKSMWFVEYAIANYKEAYKTVNRIYNSAKAKLGFRELLPGEERNINPFGK